MAAFHYQDAAPFPSVTERAKTTT
ncbi:hypothetical protein BN1263440178 [Stenotrophomonas indicatrix]|nr:hypothetical protein BN1263440178 [Stenotrophomonas indicatrix]